MGKLELVIVNLDRVGKFVEKGSAVLCCAFCGGKAGNKMYNEPLAATLCSGLCSCCRTHQMSAPIYMAPVICMTNSCSVGAW